GLRTSNDCTSTPNVRAADWVSLKPIAEYGLAEFQSTATRVSPGKISLSNSSRFPPRSGAIPGDVAARSRQTGHEPTPQRIAGRCHNDRDRPGGTLGRKWRESSTRHNDIDLESD